MKSLIHFFKLLSDETRLRIIMLLAQEQLCVCELHGLLELSQPKVSKHLSKLKDLGIVSDEKQDKFVFYKLNRLDRSSQAIIDQILSDIAQYPQLQSDQKRRINKDEYLKTCLPSR